jgi:trans-aconitate methyltransferase
LANERQFRPSTRFVATRGTKEYRATIATLRPDDVVLELGCEWGTTTALLARACPDGEVIGTDVSPECVRRARSSHPGLRFEVLDAFDVRAAMELCPSPTVVYLDLSGLSGYRSLLDLIALLQTYATVLRPATIVVKSGALKHFASNCIPWDGSREPRG